MEERRVSVDPTSDASLQSEHFDPSAYINERLKGVRMGDEARKLQTLRSELAAINSASSELLKNNVFQNFEQFIDAAKEIAHVEQEVYQLSALLSEQRSLIEGLIQMTTDDKASIHTASSSSTFNNPNSSANTTQLLIHKIDGIAAMLNSMKPSERVLLHGEATLLDPDTKQRKQRSYLVLLPDRLLIATQNAQNNTKFTLESTFALNSLAAVNVRDRESGGGDAAGLLIKLLVFPDQRYYRLDTVRWKQQWLDEIEAAKRSQLREGGLQRQATIRGRRKYTIVKEGGLGTIVDDDQQDQEQPEADAFTIQWLHDVQPDLDECLAQRDFDAAVELVMQWKPLRGKDPAVDAQILLRENQLVQMLSEALYQPRGAHGGPNAMQRPRKLLIALGRGTYAVDRYLQRRSTMLRRAYKDMAVSEEPLAHVRALSSEFADAARDTLTEFQATPEYYCQVLQFCSRELSTLLTLVKKHVIEVVPTMAVLSRTWRILASVCDTLTSFGAQLTFEMHRLLGPAMEDALSANFDQILHTIHIRMVDEQWRGAQLESEAAVHRLCEEFADLDLRIDWAIATPTSLHITHSVLEAARAALSLAVDLAPLRSSPLAGRCDDYMDKFWTELLEMLKCTTEDGKERPIAYVYSANFVISQVLPECQKAYYDEDEEPLARLLQERFGHLLAMALHKNKNGGGAEEEDEEEEVAMC